jgi:hypothetical protein
MPASAGFWEDVMSQTYINSVSELPITTGTPEIKWQENGHIRAWIDIVGFRNLSRDGDKYYILGDPATEAIIQYDAIDLQYGYLDGLEKTVSFSQSGNNLTASLHVVLKWHTVYCDKDGCFINGRFTEEKDFIDIEVVPERFIFPGNQSVTLKQYNGSVYKPQVLNFNLSPGITAYSIATNNGSITQYLKVGQVAYTSKNIPYMNLTATNHYEQSGRDISKLNNEVVFNSNLSSIEFYTQYGKLNGANITKIVMPETSIKSAVFGLIYIVVVFLGGLYVMFKSIF